jgi:hypothetical protein
VRLHAARQHIAFIRRASAAELAVQHVRQLGTARRAPAWQPSIGCEIIARERLEQLAPEPVGRDMTKIQPSAVWNVSPA